MTRVAVIYYSSTGHVHRLADAVREGAEEAGAEVRLRRVEELAPEEAIRQNPDWAAHRDATRHVEVAALDDLEWADAYIFGTPTRFGNVAAQLKQFLDSTGALWAEGKLAGRIASGFTSSENEHGGQETTLLSLYSTMYHWGAIVVAPGYTDPRVFASGGNPYGASSTGAPSPEELDGARHLGERVTAIAARLGAPLTS